MLDDILSHLGRLVSIDTSNPPRRIDANHAIVAYVTAQMEQAGLAVSVSDLGDGCVNVLGVRGDPTMLLNCHLDTVPDAGAWDRDPLALSVDDGRAIGLGACDVKGAASCLLAAIGCTDAPVALLLTTDEEAGQSRCVRSFCSESVWRPSCVVVSEPTSCRAVTRHRGVFVAEVDFTGESAHTSRGGGKSAVHDAVRWAAQALASADDGPLADQRFNIGSVDGGAKANMRAASARLVVGMRPRDDQSAEQAECALETLVCAYPDAKWTTRFRAPGLVSSPVAQECARSARLAPGAGVDFWTEAALFASAGIPALVFGPGDIAQAHAPDEFVTLAELSDATDAYVRMLEAAITVASSGS